MEAIALENIKNKWKKVPYIEKKAVYPIFKQLTPEEVDKLFSDDIILEKFWRAKDKDVILYPFRYGGEFTQDRIWSDSTTQKKLLGIGAISDEALLQTIEENKFYHSTGLEKKDKAGKFYFSKERMRVFELFMRTIKSPRILESLPANPYYQMIILFSKKVPTAVFNGVDTTQLFENTISSSFYQYASQKTKAEFCKLLNSFTPSILLPPDYREVFSEKSEIQTYYSEKKKRSIGHLLRSKLYFLYRNNQTLSISQEELKLLTIREICILMKDENGVVNKEEIENALVDFITSAIQDGSILSPKYIDFELLSDTGYFEIFRTITKVLLNGEKCNDYLSYLYKHLWKGQYTEEELALIFPLLKNCMLNVDQKTIENLFFQPNDLKSTFFIRFGLSSRYMNYLNGISPRQLLRLNVKHINKISNYIQDDTQDEISDTYSKAIKLYCIFGLERTISILSGEYGEVKKQFLDNVSKLVVQDVEFKENGKKYTPILNLEFLTFLFQGGHIKHIFERDTNLAKGWSYLYNNFDTLRELCHGHLTFPKVEVILKEKTNTVNYHVPPNCHPLEDVLPEIGVGNKTKYGNNEVYEQAVNTYQQQLKRVTSSIPYVEGIAANGYRFETMRLHDTIGYILGYRASCCIRVLDIAHKHLLHALLCESGRILIMYDTDNNPVAFSPLKRNGEVLITNSIETIAKNDRENILEAFTAGIHAIVQKSKEEEEKNSIRVVTIGRNSYLKPIGTHWPDSIPTPTILERKDKVYGSTGEYHTTQDIIHIEPNTSLTTLYYGKTETKYQDPRKKIQACDFTDEDEFVNQQNALNIISGIEYENLDDAGRVNFRKTTPHGIQAVFYSEDWYVLVNRMNSISYGYLPYDKRAEKEMRATISIVKEAIATKKIKQLLLEQKKED